MKTQHHKLPLLLLLLFGLVFPNTVSAEDVTVKNCKVSFSTTGEPNLVKIIGKSETDCEGKASIDGGKVTTSEFKLKLDKLDTGVGLRNKHLKENYLEVDKFPEAKLSITSIEGLAEQKAGSAKGTNKFSGELELHGVKKPVADGAYEIKGGKVTATFAMDLPDWNIKRPDFMGVKVVDKVYITVNFDL